MARSHLYHEGYEERSVKDGFGFKTIFVYTGNYYRPRISKEHFVFRKILNFVLTVISSAAMIVGGASKISANSSIVMNIFQMLGIFACIACLICSANYTAAPYKMEIHHYKLAHAQFLNISLASWLVAAALFICAVICILNKGEGFSLTSAIFAAMYLIAAAAMFFIWFLEYQTDYEALLPEN